MKKKTILLISLSLMISSFVMAQKISLNGGVSFTLPGSMKKIDASNVESFAKMKNIKTVTFPPSADRSFYLVDDMLVTLNASRTKEKYDLLKLKKGFDEMARDAPGFKSKIVVINGNKFLLTENTIESKFSFFGTNSNGSSAVNGILEFNEASRSSAKSLLNSIISNISFDK